MSTSTLDVYQIIETLHCRDHDALGKVKKVLDPSDQTLWIAYIYKHDAATVPVITHFLDTCGDRINRMRQFSHPHVAQLKDIVSNGLYTKKDNRGSYTCFYVIVEYCPCGNLLDLICLTPAFDESTARLYFLQLAEAVEALCLYGIPPRYVKLENSLLAADYTLKVSIFSLTDISGFSFNPSNKQKLVRYLSPESYVGREFFTEGCTVFQLGICLFHLYIHSPPFMNTNTSDRIYSVFLRCSDKFWDSYERRAPQPIPPQFKLLVGKLLAHDSCNRAALREVRGFDWCAGSSSSVQAVVSQINQRRLQELQEARNTQNAQVPHGLPAIQLPIHREEVRAADTAESSQSLSLQDDEYIPQPLGARSQARFTSLVVGLTPKTIMKVLWEELMRLNAFPTLDLQKCGYTATYITPVSEVAVLIQCFSRTDGLYQVIVQRTSEDELAMIELVGILFKCLSQEQRKFTENLPS